MKENAAELEKKIESMNNYAKNQKKDEYKKKLLERSKTPQPFHHTNSRALNGKKPNDSNSRVRKPPLQKEKKVNFDYLQQNKSPNYQALSHSRLANFKNISPQKHRSMGNYHYLPFFI